MVIGWKCDGKSILIAQRWARACRLCSSWLLCRVSNLAHLYWRRYKENSEWRRFERITFTLDVCVCVCVRRRAACALHVILPKKIKLRCLRLCRSASLEQRCRYQVAKPLTFVIITFAVDSLHLEHRRVVFCERGCCCQLLAKSISHNIFRFLFALHGSLRLFARACALNALL